MECAQKPTGVLYLQDVDLSWLIINAKLSNYVSFKNAFHLVFRQIEKIVPGAFLSNVKKSSDKSGLEISGVLFGQISKVVILSEQIHFTVQ